VEIDVDRFRQNWGINADMDLRKIRYENVDRIKLAENRFLWRDLVKTLTNPCSIKGVEFLD
jgi:hypothetical protein